MSSPRLTEADEGKRVVSAEGFELGILAGVREGTPVVDPDPNVVEKVEAEFHVGDPTDDAFPLETAEVAEITDDEVRLR